MRIGREVFWRVSGVLTLAAVWQLTGHVNKSPALPPLSGVIQALFHFIRDGPFVRHVGASLTIILGGLLVAVCVGFTVGLLLFRYKRLRLAAMPVIECIRGVASLTLFPLLIVMFGLGTFSRVFIIFWTAWSAIVLSTLNSLDIGPNVIDAAHDAGASEWQIIFYIRIPMATQGLLTGVRIGAGGGWIALIPAEMLGATKGLGYYLLWSAQSFEFEKVYATIITIAAIGGLMNLALLLLQEKLKQITGGS